MPASSDKYPFTTRPDREPLTSISKDQSAPTPEGYTATPDPVGVPQAALVDYLKTKGYSDSLAARMAPNIAQNPTYPGNAQHLKGAQAAYQEKQQYPYGRGYQRADMAGGTAYLQDPTYGGAMETVMTPQGSKQVPTAMAKWLCANGMATPQQDARNQPGYYMAQALPMAQAMSQKWGIAPDQAANITTKLLSPLKANEQNPIVGQQPADPTKGY